MFNFFRLSQVVKNEYDTYYNFATGKPVTVWWKLSFIAVISILLASNNFVGSSEFLSSTIAVNAILVGFSFNVLFFLLSNKKIVVSDEASLEGQLRADRLNRLSQELFYNVTYFSVVSFLCLFLALLLLMPRAVVGEDGSFGVFLRLLKGSEFFGTLAFLPSRKSVASWLSAGVACFIWLNWVLFFACLLESIYTFLRTVARVGFYFEELIRRS